MNQTVTLVDPSHIASTLSARYFDLQKRLPGVKAPRDRDSYRDTLKELAQLISKRAEISDWPADFTGRLLLMCCAFGRTAVLDKLADGSLERDRAVTVAFAEWLLSIAVAAGPTVEYRSQTQVCGLWVMAQITAADLDAPEACLAAAESTLAAVGLSLPAEDLRRQIQAQIVVAASRLAGRGQHDAVAEVIRHWCSELLTVPECRPILLGAANALQVHIPPPPAITPPSAVAVKPSSRHEPPSLWSTPQLIAAARVDDALRDCLIHLVALTGEPDALSARIGSALLDLAPDSKPSDIGRVFYGAARDIWKGYWTSGDPRHLPLAESVTLYMLSAAPSGDDRERSNTLHLWMNTQLPALIRTCDLEDLIADAERVAHAMGCPAATLRVRQAIIEAHAGAWRAASSEGADSQRAFLEDRRDELRAIHNSYVRDAVTGASEDERQAWEQMFPATAAVVSGADSETTAPLPLPAATPTQLPALRDAVRRGSDEGTRDFIAQHEDQLRSRLAERLKARLSPDHLLPPEGVIFTSGGVRELNPRFVDARTALQSGDYPRAALLFKKLVDGLQGRPKDIARSFEAFALAKNDDLLPARMALFPLAKAGSSYPSVHWNLACCIQPEQMDQRLEVLTAALESAPHERILHGAVSLALLLDNQVLLSSWLPTLPFVEALLIAYALQHDHLDNPGRDKALDRLRKYLETGEPVVPDATAKLPNTVVSGFINTMLDRYQEGAVDFWLRCREPGWRKHYEFWQAKGEFLQNSGKPKEALEAFREELKCSMSWLQNAKTPPPPHVLTLMRRRAEDRLLQCMTPERRDIGQDIYNQLITARSGALAPRDSRLRAFYGEGSDTPPPKDGPRPGGASSVSAGETAATSIDSILAKAGAECHERLHELSDLPMVEASLRELATSLQASGRKQSSDGLLAILKEWGNYSRLSSRSDQVAALAAGQSTLATFRGRLHSELSTSQRLLARQLEDALERALSRLAKTFKLLPTLHISPVTGDRVLVDKERTRSAVAVRVTCGPDDLPCSIIAASAVVEGTATELASRDAFDVLQTRVAPGCGAVLTFDSATDLAQDSDYNLRVELRYSCGGGSFASHAVVQMSVVALPSLPPLSPYIHGRKLEPAEIDGHFFGRVDEQRQILDSVSDGQQKVRYIEGIRRAGKSSLLSSVVREIDRLRLPLLPVYWSPGAAGSVDHVGKILFDLVSEIGRHPEVRAAAVTLPSEDDCCKNLPGAYSALEEELRARLPDTRVLVLADDFQTLVEAAFNVRDSNPGLRSGILGFLNRIYERATPSARMLWVLAGQRAFRQYRTLLGGALLWGTAKPLPIDFLGLAPVGQIVRAPLEHTGYFVPDETIERVHLHTAGHPEVVQELASEMLELCIRDGRHVITPADTDSAAAAIARFSDTFAETWYPLAELTKEQRALMASFVHAAPVGGRLLPHLLVKDRQLTEAQRGAVDDLVARKILIAHADGTVSVKARVLDAWLHRTLPTMVTDGMNGSVAIFIDVANLTAGTGASVVKDLQTRSGEEGVPGRFRLTTVIDHIESYARTLSAAPIGPRWVVNFPKKSPAVTECNAKDYFVENVPNDLWEKGDDDRILIEKISEIELGYPNVNHFILVLGDKGYRLKARSLLNNGKTVHVVSPQGALAGIYDAIAAEYPEHFDVHTLEELIEPNVALT